MTAAGGRLDRVANDAAAASAVLAGRSFAVALPVSSPTEAGRSICSGGFSSGASSMTGMRKREPHSGQAPDGPASWPAHGGGARWDRETRSAALFAAGPAAPTTRRGRRTASPWGHRRRPWGMTLPPRSPPHWEYGTSRRSAGILPAAPPGPPDNEFDARSGRETRSRSHLFLPESLGESH